MYFVVQYRMRAENAALRSVHHPAHIKFRKDLGKRLLLSGPLLSTEGGDPIGSLLIVYAESVADATKLAGEDPLCLHGVYELLSVSSFKPMSINPVLNEPM